MGARPPLGGFFVFYTVVGSGGFKHAAEQLLVTPGAVSRQIQSLEAFLGVSLFARLSRSIQLTDEGMRLYEQISPNIENINIVIDRFRRAKQRDVVRIDCGMTFAMHCLIPRLSHFYKEHIGIDIEIKTSDSGVEHNNCSDIYIRREASDLKDFSIVPMFDEKSILVEKPGLLGRIDSHLDQRLLQTTRIGAVSRRDLWDRWAQHHNFSIQEYQPTLEFTNTALAIQAVVQGLGVMVVPRIFVIDMIRDGRLVELEDQAFRTGSYWMAVRPSRSIEAKTSFMNWFLQRILTDISNENLKLTS